eukprot:TRINITY_DN6004_c0_g1_i2.p1 TRINITY_DN6004_c0_g1~~TRINITY_DN6004_c0_g1_i2.p1  ORF type:complete len:169 (+),score=44.28 TRINITY_DN6004_c0_g1_i2:370-876(+)
MMTLKPGGCGVVGLFFALRGCEVVLTDLEELIPHLEANAQANQTTIASSGGSVRVQKLDWDFATESDIVSLYGNNAAEEGFDFVLGSELLYVGTLEEGFKPLIRVLKTLLKTTKSGREPRAYFADEWDYGMRDTFFEELREEGFRVEVLVKDNCFHIYSIFSATKASS